LAVNNDLATVGGVKAVSDTHRRRLTRTILTDDGMNRPRLNDYVDMIISENVAKSFRYLSEFEHVVFEPRMNANERGSEQEKIIRVNSRSSAA
jgi:hypothetical protein